MIKHPMPTRRMVELNILPSRDEMGKMAAGDVAEAMNRFIETSGNVNIVFAAAPSQDEFLLHLSMKREIDWSRVTCFHLDDYVDLPRNHPNTFEVYLQEHLLNHLQPKQVHFLKAQEGTPAEMVRKYTRLIDQSGGIHICCIGIGENGHIAFCEPGSALNDPRLLRIIRIDERSVRQQYRDYKDHPNPVARYASLQAVPRKAFTMTVPAILSAQEIYAIVPGPQKATAVKRMWEGPISSACPSSALRMHSRVKIYLDEDSARRLT